MTQQERVLKALKARGREGITVADFLLPDVIDGGKPITRLAARILELRDKGHEIAVVGERNCCAVYRLYWDAEHVPTPKPTEPTPEDGQLFGLPSTNAIYGDAA